MLDPLSDSTTHEPELVSKVRLHFGDNAEICFNLFEDNGRKGYIWSGRRTAATAQLRVVPYHNNGAETSNICSWCSISSLRIRYYSQATCSRCSQPSCPPVLGRNIGKSNRNVRDFPLTSHATRSSIHNDSEALYEAEDLPKESRQLAALIVSKVYYYLEAYDEALSFALSAGPAFEAEARTQGAEEYVETVVCE
jgi:hypothetical protein